jgi:hypothetical protein
MGDAAACRIPDDRLLVMLPSSTPPADQSLRLSADCTMRRLRVRVIFLNGVFGVRLPTWCRYSMEPLIAWHKARVRRRAWEIRQ